MVDISVDETVLISGAGGGLFCCCDPEFSKGIECGCKKGKTRLVGDVNAFIKVCNGICCVDKKASDWCLF